MPPSDRWKARRRVFMWATLTLWAAVSGILHALMVAAPERPGHVAWDVRLAARNVEHVVLGADPARSAWHPEGPSAAPVACASCASTPRTWTGRPTSIPAPSSEVGA